ncbi:MAG: DinB family protein [Caldilineaceae bacterium]
MNANAFRHFYEYHISENTKIWEICGTQLSEEQFTQAMDYSHGSVRDQIVHIINCDDLWFSELQNIESLEPPPHTSDRATIRAHWDQVERRMRAYLAGLQDEMLLTKPIQEPEEDRVLSVWQVLLHVANHATDHRAQLLRQLNDLGVTTSSQDYIFYVYEHL